MMARDSQDWYPGEFPTNIVSAPTAYIGSSYSFRHFRSRVPEALSVGPHATLDDGVTLDVGPRGKVRVGAYAIITGAVIVCDAEVTLGDYAMVAWNAVLVDTFRRRPENSRAATDRQIHVGRGAWVGIGACILPGVRIGDGAIVGAGAVVFESVPAGMLVAGNPARIVRAL